MPQWRRALWIALAVNTAFFLTEIGAGIDAGSAALQVGRAARVAGQISVPCVGDAFGRSAPRHASTARPV